MKKHLIIFVLICNNLSFSQFQDMPFEIAQKIALDTNKLILLDFGVTWHDYNEKMERETWSDENVIHLLENYIVIKINLDYNLEFQAKHNIANVPSIALSDGNGKLLNKFEGYTSKSEIVKFLEKYSLSTEFLSAELINYSKFPTASSAIRLSQKYLDYSLYLDEDLKNPFRNLAENYLLEAKQKVKTEKPENIDSQLQRIELLSYFRDLYDKKYEKVEKKINKKIKESEIYKDNIDTYYLINYISSKGLDKTENFKSWEQKISSLENTTEIIKKANAILNQGKTQ